MGAVVIALIVVAPIAAIFWIALHPAENIWPHLISTTLPRYLGNTLWLMVGVALVAGSTGSLTAWLVTQYRFPGRNWLQWALLLPLAVPAYLGAYALVDFLEYAGPVQKALRAAFGWQTARDYWFPEVRSFPMAVLVIAASLYPYVYLLTRAAFRAQSAAAHDVARALGAGPVARFWRIALPLARPALAAGLAVVMMETVNDFGTVDYFAVQTLTTGIFTVWLEANNTGGAAQIACVVLIMMAALVGLERASRAKARFYALSRRQNPTEAAPMHGVRAWLCTLACLLPILIGFVLPVAVLGRHAMTVQAMAGIDRWRAAATNTITTGAAAALVSVIAALFLVYAVRLSGRHLPRRLLPVTTIGYAAPGAVLGIGVLVPLAALDHGLADGVLELTGWDPGLLLTGSAVALVMAYCVRFFAIAVGATDAAMGQIPPNLPAVARSLGRNKARTLRDVHLPLIQGSVTSALLLVFVDCVKELPATLLLRPFNFDTLATLTHEQAALEKLEAASPPGLLVIAISLFAVALLARTNR